MGYFENNSEVNFEKLEKAIDKDGKRVYSPRLIQKIKNGDYNVLNEINPVDKNDREFMEPLLYAVKK